MCRRGARAAPPLNATAVRRPEPVTMKASGFPLTQPGRSMISWTTAARFGVRWLGPASPMTDHAGGDHATDAVVRGREETFAAAVVNVPAASAAWPWTVSDEALPSVSSVVNCTDAFWITAPSGSATPANRTPTTWTTGPSTTTSRAGLGTASVARAVLSPAPAPELRVGARHTHDRVGDVRPGGAARRPHRRIHAHRATGRGHHDLHVVA